MVHSKYSLLLENILDPVKLPGDSYLRKLTTNHKSPVLNSNNRHSTRQVTVKVQTVNSFSLNIAPMALKERYTVTAKSSCTKELIFLKYTF